MEGCGEATTGRTADGSIIYAYRFNQGTPCDPAIGGPGVYPPLYGVVFPIDGRPPYHSETGLPYTGPIPGEFQSVPSGIAAAPTSGQQTAPDAGGKPAASFLGLPVHSSDLPAARTIAANFIICPCTAAANRGKLAV